MERRVAGLVKIRIDKFFGGDKRSPVLRVRIENRVHGSADRVGDDRVSDHGRRRTEQFFNLLPFDLVSLFPFFVGELVLVLLFFGVLRDPAIQAEFIYRQF